MRARAKQWLFRIFLAGMMALATTFLFEIAGQTFLFPGQLYFVNDVDHRMKPRSSSDVNSDGIRSLVEADQFRPEDLNIVFLGDSFIYGYGVRIEDSIPRLFEVMSRSLHPDRQIHVANFGWVGSSPLLSYRLLKDIGRKYNPDVVILGLDMTDVHDDMRNRRLLHRSGIYRVLPVLPITFVAVSKVLARIRTLDPFYEWIFGIPSSHLFIMERPLSETRPYFEETRQDIEAINRYCRQVLHAKFILMILPRGYQYNVRESPRNWEKYAFQPGGPYSLEPFRYFEELRGKADYPIHSLLKDFQTSNVFPTCFDADPHYNPEGDRIAAEAI